MNYLPVAAPVRTDATDQALLTHFIKMIFSYIRAHSSLVSKFFSINAGILSNQSHDLLGSFLGNTTHILSLPDSCLSRK